MAESILDYEKRPVRYNAIDGVDEMLLGFLFLALPLLMHLANIAPQGSIWHWKPTSLIAEVPVLVAFLIGRKLLKERITYRRTGYVKFRYSKLRSAIGGIVAFAVAAAVAVCIALLWPRQREGTLILLGCLLWAGFYAYFFIYKTKMYRTYRFLTALLIAAAPLAVYSALPNVRDISTLSSAVLGACWLISGVITFWSYLRNTQPAGTQTQTIDDSQ